jgi:hypothetical protein
VVTSSPQSAHFTPRGHQVVAAALETFLDAAGLIGAAGTDPRPATDP